MPLKKRSARHQARHVVYALYRIFEPHINKGRKPRILAAQALSQIKASKPTIIKARKALGIKSVKIAGRFYWRFPTRTPQQALAFGRLQKVKPIYLTFICRNCQITFTFEQEPLGKPWQAVVCPQCNNKKTEPTRMSYNALENFKMGMKELGYFAYSREALQHLQEQVGLKRWEIYKCKGILGVERYLDDNNRSYWIWIAPAVIDWLDEQVTQEKPARVADIMTAAEALGWSEVLIIRTSDRMKMIKRLKIGNEVYWHDPVNA